MLLDKFDFLESLMREEFPENQERVIVSTIYFQRKTSPLFPKGG